MNRVRSIAGSSIGDCDGDGEGPVVGVAWRWRNTLNPHVVVCERRVRQTVAEGEQWGDSARIVVLVPHPYAFFVMGLCASRLEAEECRDVLLFSREGQG